MKLIYRIYKDDDERLTIITLWEREKPEDFVLDDHITDDDFDSSRYMTDDREVPLVFIDESDAVDWLNECIKPSMIDPQYIKNTFNKADYFL